MAGCDVLQPLRDHAVYRLVSPLETFVGIGRDLVVLTELFSLAAGIKATPVNLDVTTDVLGLDQCVADRLLSICPDYVARIDTYAQFRAEESNGFENRAVLWVRRGHNRLYRSIASMTARAVDSGAFAPSVWRFVAEDSEPFLAVPTLRLFTNQAHRDLSGFAQRHAVLPGAAPEAKYLRESLDALTARTSYPCSFREHFVGTAKPLDMLIVERLLPVFANLRRIMREFPTTPQAVTIEDYRAVRALLISLPLTPIDRSISAHAIDTADRLFSAIHSNGHQLSLPDRSAEGHQWFTRADAIRWTGFGYTTVKKHLGELEDDGILVSTVAQNNRDHGRQIHFRFADTRAPPFGWANPFEALPDL